MNEITRLERANVKRESNYLSKLFFGYALPLFYKGTKRDLELTDLFQIYDNDRSKVLAERLDRTWVNELLKSKENANYKPSLRNALVQTFKWNYFLLGILYFGYTAVSSVFPIFIYKMIQIYNNVETTPDFSQKLLYYSSCIVGMLFVRLFFYNHLNLGSSRLEMKAKTALSALIYRKITRLKQSALYRTTQGQIINLLSNDLRKLEDTLIFSHSLWLFPFQMLFISYFLWLDVGVSCLFGLTALALQCLPIQSYLAKLIAVYRSKIAKLTDKRIHLMSEIISGIQVIKMYAWEQPFEQMVHTARTDEVKYLKRSAYLKSLQISFMIICEKLTLFITVVAYALFGNQVTPESVFSLAQFFNVLMFTMSIQLPFAVSNMSELNVNLKRIQQFLMLDEKPTLDSVLPKVIVANVGVNGEKPHNEQNDDQTKRQTPIIKFENVTATWNSDDKPTLTKINLTIQPGELCAIIGPVGCGKSSLLQVLLREPDVLSGKCIRNGTMSYASQEAWLFSGTIRNNILFGQTYDRERYADVIKVCALETDFSQLPFGDETLIGDQGCSLSGGQKARLNLARAVYRKTDVYLLDDPLSAVDTHVGKHLFERCIRGFLADKTVILVTHQTQYLKDTDSIVVLSEGKIQAHSKYNELRSNSDLAKILVDEEVVPETEALPKLTMNTNDGKELSEANEFANKLEEEGKESGTIKLSLYAQFLRAGASIPILFVFLLAMIVNHSICVITDYWIVVWTSASAQPLPIFTNESIRIEATPATIDNNFYIVMYGVLVALTIITTVSRGMFFMNILLNASKNLHGMMFHVLLEAPMRFFNKNPIGRVLNRFSKDIGMIDDNQSTVFLLVSQNNCVILGSLILICMVNPFMIVVVSVTLIMIGVLTKFYLGSAQDAKRLEGILKSPVFSHVSATLDGLATIRHSNSEHRTIDEFDAHQDLHSSASYLVAVLNSAFAFWIDFICLMLLTATVFGFWFVPEPILVEIGGGKIGLAISQALILVTITQHAVRQIVQAICNMTSVERVIQYTKLEREGPFYAEGDKTVPIEWPQQGNIEFDNFSMKYSQDERVVLKDLTLRINPSEKIGIVGRTGAGKSSFISSLFRLAVSNGRINIDNVDIETLGLKHLRSHISIIPQVPVLFTGTLRSNLDPFNEYTDDVIWSALEQVELKDTATSLDEAVLSGGSNFSIGQRQLLCLARAILRRNKILVLDEATANVDFNTDAFIQNTIRDKFSDCTVLTIAHRLLTIMDSDRVMVMDAGRVVEFEHPYVLLKDSTSFFSKLVFDTDEATSRALLNIAKESYFQKRSRDGS